MNYYSWIPFCVIAIDQMTKRIATYWNDNNILVEYYWFSSKLIWNKGISFGLFASSYYNVLVYCAIILSIILVLVAWYKSKSALDTIAWGLIVGGGMSNLWDRWFFGAVSDFILVSIGEFNFPVFNVADIAVTLGGLILARRLFSRKKSKKSSGIHENTKTK